MKNNQLNELVRYLKDQQVNLKNWGQAECDVRVQVVDGRTYYHHGDSSYDQDHRGNWAAGYITINMTRAELLQVAEDMTTELQDEIEVKK